MAPEPTCFDILAALFARDVDLALMARSLARTPTERIEWLEEMQAFAEEAREAREHEAVPLIRPGSLLAMVSSRVARPQR